MAEFGQRCRCIYWMQNDRRPHIGECRHNSPPTSKEAGCGEFKALVEAPSN